jgi:hypothetical protein
MWSEQAHRGTQTCWADRCHKIISLKGQDDSLGPWLASFSKCLSGTIPIVLLLLSITHFTFSEIQNAPATQVNQNAAISAEFDKRVNDYMNLRHQAQAGLSMPKNTTSSRKITDYKRELAAKIRDLRPQARQGDTFTPEIAELFRRLISQSLNGPDSTKIRKSYERAEPIHGVRVQVNQTYPDSLPLQSMPPSLLFNLPKLPKELEYRFVGHQLVLRDIPANLIVDLIPEVVTPDRK